MKVRQFHTKNQFLITDNGKTTFQSYNSIIAVKEPGKKTLLDSKYWDYSQTTGKYRNLFLGENKKTTEEKIKAGDYILTDLN